jgi:hypothetical protein
VDIAVELDARTNMGWHPTEKRQDPDQSWWQIPFLSDEARREAIDEMGRLAATKSGPDYLIAETMRYAATHPNDPRVPEALHFAVRTQRFGCVRKETQAASKEAWRLLANRYTRSKWAKDTVYTIEPDNIPKPEPQR